ncbi:MAG: STAS/SEC14 domain-containing protein [Cyanobacteria bacterium]|nr:STAS/SEC14 domain-containing protein [Cyanobacteriota bacterium]
MSVDELLMAVEDLNESDLDNLVDRALFLRARRKTSVSSSEETILLKIINQGIPNELNDRYRVLAEKRDEEILSSSESEELLSIGHQIEVIGVNRVEALAKLSVIRQTPLLKLMDSLGIQSPGVR